MGLETATTINELVESWPLQTDKIRQGAGHLRVLKEAIKATFPALTGPVTATQASLNSLPTDFSALLTELLKHVEHKGSIKIHDLTNAPIPATWVLCDGHTEPGYGVVPDYRDRFVVGAGNSYANREVGGSISKTTTTVAHTHNGTTGGTAITNAQMPSHGHRVWMNDTSAGGSGKALWALDNAPQYVTQSGNSTGHALVEPTGGGNPHDHSIALTDGAHSHDVADIRPPYIGVVWIVKVTEFVAP